MLNKDQIKELIFKRIAYIEQVEDLSEQNKKALKNVIFGLCLALGFKTRTPGPGIVSRNFSLDEIKAKLKEF